MIDSGLKDNTKNAQSPAGSVGGLNYAQGAQGCRDSASRALKERAARMRRDATSMLTQAQGLEELAGYFEGHSGHMEEALWELATTYRR